MNEKYGIVPLQRDERKRFQSLFNDLWGPAPWGIDTYKPITTARAEYRWAKLETSWVGLFRNGEQQPVLELGMYVRPFAITNGLLGGWAPYKVGDVTRGIETRCFLLDELIPFEDGKEPLDPGFFNALVSPASSVVLPQGLTDGSHVSPDPGAFIGCNEILLLCDTEHADDSASVAIYSWLPARRELNVYNLEWFNGRDYDLGYEWITDLVRDPVSSHILGRGVRIPSFELDDSNKSVLRWFWAFG